MNKYSNYGTNLEFVQGNWGKPQTFKTGYPITLQRFQPSIFRIQV